MAFIAKPVKDLDTGEVREIIAEMSRVAVGGKLDEMNKRLERIAVALEAKSK